MNRIFIPYLQCMSYIWSRCSVVWSLRARKEEEEKAKAAAKEQEETEDEDEYETDDGL